MGGSSGQRNDDDNNDETTYGPYDSELRYFEAIGLASEYMGSIADKDDTPLKGAGLKDGSFGELSTSGIPNDWFSLSLIDIDAGTEQLTARACSP